MADQGQRLTCRNSPNYACCYGYHSPKAPSTIKLTFEQIGLIMPVAMVTISLNTTLTIYLSFVQIDLIVPVAMVTMSQSTSLIIKLTFDQICLTMHVAMVTITLNTTLTI